MSKMLDVARKAVEAVEAGQSVYAFLGSSGYKNPSSTWYMLKQQAKKHDPELYEKMCFLTGDPKTAVPKPAKEKPGENPVPDRKAVETVFFGGKEYEKMDGPSPTCCQPAKPSGVTVPDELPEEKPKAPGKPLPVCAVKSRVKGEWHLSQVEGCVHLIWEDRITHEERSLGLPAADWMKLAGEIPQMLMQLGLAN